MSEYHNTRAPQWISVEDRLPEIGVPVLVVELSPSGRRVVCDVRNNLLSTSATHWMPLPAPPEEIHHE